MLHEPPQRASLHGSKETSTPSPSANEGVLLDLEDCSQPSDALDSERHQTLRRGNQHLVAEREGNLPGYAAVL